MSDYSPDKLYPKWAGDTDGQLERMRRAWETGRPRKHWFPFKSPEPDSRLDRITPSWVKRRLLHEGTVVLGHFARAFFPAYIPGKNAHYGSVVYSIDPIPLKSLFELAWGVNELRQNSEPPPKGSEYVAQAIRNDRSSYPRIELPPQISKGRRCYFGNLCIQRSRLPLNYLHDRLVPVLIAPEKTDCCCLLPLRFWDAEFKSIWCSGPPAYDPAAFAAQCAVYNIKP